MISGAGAVFPNVSNVWRKAMHINGQSRPHQEKEMYCIQTQTYPDGYTVIRVSDKAGAVFSLCGYNATLRLLESHGIDTRNWGEH